MNILRFLAVFFFGICFSQNGYNITLKTKNLEGKTIRFSLYNGTSRYPFKTDSAKISKADEVVTFRKAQKIHPFIGLISTAETGEKLDIAVENNANFTIEIDGNLSSAKTSDLVNQQFFDYQKIPSLAEKDRQIEVLRNANSGNILGLYATLESRKINSKDFSGSDVKTSEFLNGIDLNDKSLSVLPNTYSFLNTYFNLQPLSSTNYKKAADLLLKGQDCDAPNFIYYLKWIFNNLQYNESTKLSDAFSHIYSEYLNNEKCIDKDKVFYSIISTKLTNYGKLMLGTKVSDFDVVDLNGKVSKISRLINQNSLVVFYDPDCSHCRENLPKVNDFISELEKSSGKKINKIAFYNVSDDGKWRGFVEEFHLEGWKNIKNYNQNYDYKTHLDVFSNPNYYILSKDLELLSKKYSEDEIRRLLFQQ
ncbi:hypothetical protein [Chryseobacterium koreense]|uniref:TlpA family protein disulfide reductase n=1 Tax=Chryseobacterium koreense TaxID=232216 RepID=UPI0026EDAEF7|nr:hypothetical protein [Chryseobacterium koreense]